MVNTARTLRRLHHHFFWLRFSVKCACVTYAGAGLPLWPAKSQSLARTMQEAVYACRELGKIIPYSYNRVT